MADFLIGPVGTGNVVAVTPGNAFRAGTFSSLASGSGAPLATATPLALASYADDNGASIADSVRNFLARTLLTYDQTGGSIRSVMGQLKLIDGVDVTSGIYTAVQGYLELAATHSAKTGSTLSCIDASAEIGTALTVDSGGEFCGIHVETTGSGTITNNGTCAGILIDKASGAASWPVGLQIVSSTVTNGIDIGICAEHQINISGTWGVGVAGAAIAIGDYSTPIAFGTISDHLLAQVINISGAVDDDSNIMPLHVAFTTTADCGANSVAQVIYARATIAHTITDCYSVRARCDITDETTPTLNLVTGVFSTLTTKLCNIGTTGNIAAIIATVDGTQDVTTSGYGKLSGMYIHWNQTNALTADSCGTYLGVATGATLDSGYRVNAAGTLGISFHSHNSSGTMTTALSIEGAHTNAFAFPAEGTAPVVNAATAMAGLTSDGYIVVTVDGTAHKMYYFA